MKKQLIMASAAITLWGCGGGSNSDTNTAQQDTNSAPSISAGDDITTDEGETISLDGTLVDNEGDASVSWAQVDGPAGIFSSVSIIDPDFEIPRVDSDTSIILEVTADDGTNPPVSDRVTIFVEDRGRRSNSPQDIDDDDRRDRRDKARVPGVQVDGREVRSFDGSSNNLTNIEWGAAFTHLERLVENDYADGISSLAGPLRPSARAVSNAISAQAEGESVPNSFDRTDFVWQWGQFMDHDIGLTDGAEESADIVVPSGDTFFDPDNSGTQVIFFNRALFDPDSGTSTSDPREQENEITAWIDGSMVYGSDDERADALRVTPDSPYLATSDGNLLPFNTDSLGNANGFVEDPTTLFLAGDVRVNEQVGLATMHTLFVREHNRLVDMFLDEDRNADPEAVFQSARRLVIAEIQIITYNEFLPALIGPNAIPDYTGYDDTVSPGLFNSFSVAAFRLGHSLLNERLLRLDASGNETSDGHLNLREAFFTAPDVLTSEDSLDPILRGLATQTHQTIDPLVVSDVRNFLFGQPGAGGFDLVALNIQRGRDHGVPSYNDMRDALGLGRVTSFSEITSNADRASALEATYTSVDDVDLWVGGLAEDPLTSEGSQLGELFREMMIIQWSALRDGDRFWYENDLEPDELSFVEGTTLARVIRQNTDIGDELQDDVFSVPQ